MDPLDRQRVLERLSMFDEMLEQDEFVKKQRERGRQEGKIEACQTILVDIVRRKFPSLEDLAQQRAAQIEHIAVFCEVIWLVIVVKDENMARFILTPIA